MKNLLYNIFLTVLLLSGCKSHRVEYVPVESIRTERLNRYIRDLQAVHDSVFIREAGDTVFMYKYKTLTSITSRTDTFIRIDTIALPYPVTEYREVQRELTWLEKTQVYAGRIFFAAIFIAMLWFSLKKKYL
ncbi:MAG: hypothetical protein LBJ60_01745 [Tannerellaceae bacterium]|jgi:hypothetical protein|nr:hypothetical protein [Tannerellaceae bacterium]